MSKEKKKQHLIPQAYLKYFSVNKHLFVYQLRNKYKRDIQLKGIGDKIFCDYEEYYYDFPNPKNKQYLENIFQKWESTDYEIIIRNITNKSELGVSTKNLLIDWILMIKTRSSYFRDNYKRLFHFFDSTKHALQFGKEAATQIDKKIRKETDEQAKAFQLSAFLKYLKDLKKAYTENFITKHWIVLEAKNNREFLTSDNAGFSLSFSYDLIRLNLSPLTGIYNLDKDVNAIHYFPLSPKYCLYLMPLLEGDLPNTETNSFLEFIKRDITYENATEDQIDKINECTICTAHKLIIARSKEELSKYNSIIQSRFT